MTVTEKAAIGLKDERRAAVGACGTNRPGRGDAGRFLCLIPKRMCLRKQEHCEKGDTP